MAAHSTPPTDPSQRPGGNPQSELPPDAHAGTEHRSVDTTRADLPPHPPEEGGKDEKHSSPLMPHERDQSVGMTDGAPDANVEQAYRDVKRGLQDTDRGQPAHEAYQKQKQ